jgi:hypothetical protein
MLRNTMSYMGTGMVAGIGNERLQDRHTIESIRLYSTKATPFDLFFPSVDLGINGVLALLLLEGFYGDIAVLCAAQKFSLLCHTSRALSLRSS